MSDVMTIPRLRHAEECPSCGSRDSAVNDSRPDDYGIRRRRRCVNCGERWSTCERPVLTYEAMEDLVEACLKSWHSDGSYGWILLKQTWPEEAVADQRLKVLRLIEMVQDAKPAR